MRIEPLLAPGEQVMWAARVNALAYWRAAMGRIAFSLALFIFSGVITGFGVIALAFLIQGSAADRDADAVLDALLAPAGAGGVGYAWLLPAAIVVLGVAGVIAALGQFAALARGASSVYAITNRRVMVAAAGSPLLRTWAPLSRVLGVQAQSEGGSGGLKITVAADAGPPVITALALTGVKRVDAVEALILDLLAPGLAPGAPPNTTPPSTTPQEEEDEPIPPQSEDPPSAEAAPVQTPKEETASEPAEAEHDRQSDDADEAAPKRPRSPWRDD